MPINYKNYAANWKTEIRPAVLKRAGNCCEECGLANYVVGYRKICGEFVDIQFIHDQLEDFGNDLFDDVLSHCYTKKGFPTPPIRIILTVAHLDQDIENNDLGNLKAMCQRCHLAHDRVFNQVKTCETIRKKKGVWELF
jgi:hypothetical protein